MRAVSAEQANLHHLVMDIAWFGVALAATSRFLSVFAVHVGASAWEVSLLMALPALVTMVSALWGGRWAQRYSNSIQAHNWPALASRSALLMVCATPWLPLDWQPLWLVACMALSAIPAGIAGVLFLTALREAVDAQHATHVVSQRTLAMNVALGLAAIGFGLLLEQVRYPLNYQLMFGAAFVASMISLWHLNQVKVIFAPQREDNSTPLLAGVHVWFHSDFRSVVRVVLGTHIAFFAVYALTPVYLVRVLGASEGFMAMFALVELAAAALMALGVRALVARLGNRGTMALAMVGTALGMLVVALAPVPAVTLVAALLLGASWSVVGISLYTEFATHTQNLNGAAHATAYMQIIGLATFLGPLIGTVLAEMGLNLQVVLVIGAAVRLAGAVAVAPSERAGRFAVQHRAQPLLRATSASWVRQGCCASRGRAAPLHRLRGCAALCPPM